MKYKYTGKGMLSFRAASTADEPSIKKVYIVNEGKEVEVPVKVNHPLLEEIKKKTKDGDK